MKNILKIIFVIIGTLIGAGFISGQEMYTFFYSYGKNGLYGLILCSIIIGYIIYKTLKIAKDKGIKEYGEFLAIIERKRKRKYLSMSYITNIIINIFIFITFCIMISGFGAFFKQEFSINNIIGSSILAIICFIILMGNVQRIVKTSGMLVPIIMIFILILGIFVIKNHSTVSFSTETINICKGNWLISSILYSSYNIILLVPILITLMQYIKNDRDIKYVSIITGIIVFLLSLTLFLLLAQSNTDISTIEMPTVYVISILYPGLQNMYGIVILISIFTTVISLGMSFLKNVTQNKKRYKQIAITMCIISVILSNIGFSNLINMLYPIFGFLGLIQIISIILYK